GHPARDCVQVVITCRVEPAAAVDVVVTAQAREYVVEAGAQQGVAEGRGLNGVDAGKGIGAFGRARGTACNRDRRAGGGLEVDRNGRQRDRIVEARVAVADDRVVAAGTGNVIEVAVGGRDVQRAGKAVAGRIKHVIEVRAPHGLHVAER